MATILRPNSEGESESTPIREVWSEAARAAASAARKHKGKGMPARRRAARNAFNKSLSSSVRKMQHAFKNIEASAARAKGARKATKTRQLDKLSKNIYNEMKRQNPERYYLFSYR